LIHSTAAEAQERRALEIQLMARIARLPSLATDPGLGTLT
jgi:hypothetical protein